ncbi:hypothetical protein G3I60_05390 [Streptomyces sp. SID13666]|uniref:hypothetical protein n=1 Tax=Streptomyces sp. SID13666 TaxID=2706054 RepID=UPI0013C25629|nr:hypothetical protein [Streptomyces sp. SID13666]NEA53605.1 hypothetical protein [Streptomyces sp. SID13666]
MTSTLSTVRTGAEIGALLPLLTAVVQRPAWSAPIKRVVAVVVALVAGVIAVLGTGGLAQLTHGIPTMATIMAVLAASQASYDLVWKPAGVAPTIESATSPKAVEAG